MRTKQTNKVDIRINSDFPPEMVRYKAKNDDPQWCTRRIVHRDTSTA